jgi:hypothetical protein
MHASSHDRAAQDNFCYVDIQVVGDENTTVAQCLPYRDAGKYSVVIHEM